LLHGNPLSDLNFDRELTLRKNIGLVLKRKINSESHFIAEFVLAKFYDKSIVNFYLRREFQRFILAGKGGGSM